jgi:hypothetical protein
LGRKDPAADRRERAAAENGASYVRMAATDLQVDFFEKHGYNGNIPFKDHPRLYDLQKTL